MSRSIHALLIVGFMCCAFQGLWATDCAVTSEAVCIDVRDDFGGALLRGRIRVSPFADPSEGGTQLLSDGEAVSSWTPAEPYIDTASLSDGWHEFRLEGAGQGVGRQLVIRNDVSIEVHGGTLKADETWAGDKVHIVHHLVRIPAGRTLTIAPGAVVKFCADTGLLVEGTLQATDAIFSRIEDDKVGGDTDLAEMTGNLSSQSYQIEGPGNLVFYNCRKRYSSVQPLELALSRGWNLVSLPSELADLEENRNRLLRLAPFGCGLQFYMVGKLPLGSGTPLWLYSRDAETVQFTAVEECLNPTMDDLIPGQFVGVPGTLPITLGGEKANYIWQWKEGRFILLPRNEDGGYTLQPRTGYMVF